MALRSTDGPAIARELDQYDAIIDARSPAEFADDHLPGAINWPVLDDEQRRIVGTLYVQDSPLAARKVGAAMVGRNIADHLDRWIADKPREWQPLVYCWRGGQRSGSLAWFLDQIGFRCTRLAGGYKGFRTVVRADLGEWPARFDFCVLAGRTGSGKTRLLQALATAGAQVLDLEALASHRGSILGGVPGHPQPTQKRFDTLLWSALQRLDPARPVYVESESRKIGRLQVPEALIEHMHAKGRVLHVQMPDEARVALLLQEYGFFADEPERFCDLLDGLVVLRGKEAVGRWQALARAGDWATVFGQLMRDHYDPLYQRSMDRHYSGYAQAGVVPLADGEPATVLAAARALMA
ncbi:tRNA 2-selenouridine(34) synthase MnmH [Ideonella sp. A 288]|uniref:tRNA 2-selenouridine(34) synthase MnmH n=1 Tax=Ideonella sp. A 288 TaxID=1962181 RepID=UPI000B4BE768|nr:tRNA 2-selenouridine(34) synthase MnmH [Ideonella sp. A 288]